MNIEKKREIKSNLLEIRQNLIGEIREYKRLKSEYYLDLPCNKWEEENCEELNNKIYEKEKDLSFVEEEIKNFS